MRDTVTMQRRHFEFIAETIRTMPTHAPTLRAQRDSCARQFADACRRTNPNFNRDKFLRACGVQED